MSFSDVYGVLGQYKEIAHEQLTIDDTATGVSLTSSNWVDRSDRSTVIGALIEIETAEVRVAADSSIDVTAGGAEGSRKKSIGDSFVVTGSDSMTDFRAIRTGSTSAKGQVTYFGAKAD
jgi:hypothetical protein